MKLYRVYYGDNIKQGMYRGYTGSDCYEKCDIRERMKFGAEFVCISNELHCPDRNEFYIPPNKNSLFYFKEDFITAYKHIIEDFISTASMLGITVNIATIDLDTTITSYQCIYQDENQMCLNIN